MRGGSTLLLGLVLLGFACGGETPPEDVEPADCVRAYIAAARAGDLDAARRHLHPRLSMDEPSFVHQRRFWTKVLDTLGLELTVHDAARDEECALVPYRLTGPAARAAFYTAGQYTLVRTDDGWKIVDDEVAEGGSDFPLAPFRVHLPRAAYGVDRHATPATLCVHLAADGRIWMDGSYVTDAEDLRHRLVKRAMDPGLGEVVTVGSHHPSGLSPLRLALRADGAASWSKVASILRTACAPDALIYKIGIGVRREEGLLWVPREIEVDLLDPGYSPWSEDPKAKPPLLVVELDRAGPSPSEAVPTLATVDGASAVPLSEGPPEAPGLREAIRARGAKLGNEADTLGVIRVAPGAGDRIPLRDVVRVMDALVDLGLSDLRLEGLACAPPEGPR